jgi:hypothetical protein
MIDNILRPDEEKVAQVVILFSTIAAAADGQKLAGVKLFRLGIRIQRTYTCMKTILMILFPETDIDALYIGNILHNTFRHLQLLYAYTNFHALQCIEKCKYFAIGPYIVH